MSTATTANHGPRETARPTTARPASAKASGVRHTPGGAALGKDAGHEARRLAAAILEVMAGVRTPAQAAEALGLSLQRYFQVETRALQALVAGCAPRPRGPGRNLDKELTALRREQLRLQRELSRQQTLVRLAQRTLGLAPPKPPTPAPGGKAKGQRRRRKLVVRALRAAEFLQRPGQQTPAEPADRAASPPAPPPQDR